MRSRKQRPCPPGALLLFKRPRCRSTLPTKKLVAGVHTSSWTCTTDPPHCDGASQPAPTVHHFVSMHACIGCMRGARLTCMSQTFPPADQPCHRAAPSACVLSISATLPASPSSSRRTLSNGAQVVMSIAASLAASVPITTEEAAHAAGASADAAPPAVDMNDWW